MPSLAVKEQVKTYKKIRPLVQFGDFIRLKDPAKGDQCAWMFVSRDKNEALVFVFDRLASAQPTLTLTKLAGLDPAKNYDPVKRHDFTADMYHFKAVTD